MRVLLVMIYVNVSLDASHASKALPVFTFISDRIPVLFTEPPTVPLGSRSGERKGGAAGTSVSAESGFMNSFSMSYPDMAQTAKER